MQTDIYDGGTSSFFQTYRWHSNSNKIPFWLWSNTKHLYFRCFFGLRFWVGIYLWVTPQNSELSWKSFANGVSSVDISSLSWKAIHVFIIVNSNNHVTFSIPLVYPLVRASGNEFRFYNFGMYFNSGTYVGGRIGVSIQRIYIDSVLLNGQEVKESSHMWVSYR